MIDIPMRTKGALDRDTILSLNRGKVRQAYTQQNLAAVNERACAEGSVSSSAGHGQVRRASAEGSVSSSAGHGQVHTEPSGSSAKLQIPSLLHPIQKGQKVPLAAGGAVRQADICLGWNSSNRTCDVDVSAFLLGGDGKVIGDEWFVFYGQTESPDRSTSFKVDGVTDREVIHVDFTKLNPAVKKLVFVLTINEAVEKKLHFGMLKDAYIRILDHSTKKEQVSFRMTDYYTNVISMMIGELYLHNGSWKFHGIGNGVARDLAGLCELYGVRVNG